MSDLSINTPFQIGGLLDGRWQVEAVLAGAMAHVLIVSDPATGRRMAAKTPRTDHELGDVARGRFESEVRTWLSLGRHENVVEAFFLERLDVGGVERPFLFLEYVDGPTLEEVLAAEGRLALPVVLDVATGIAWGVAHAHGVTRDGPGVVHRDLKPENVFLTRHRVTKVADFGLARALDRPEAVVDAGLGAGTPFYAAPEQLRDARRAGRQSDVYAFGALIYRLLTGEPPFPATTLSQLVWKVLRDDAPFPSALRADVPERLDRLVHACLAREPAHRPDGFGAIVRELSEIREDETVWLPAEGARNCPSCGWQTVLPSRLCPICEHPTEDPERYAPASSRSLAATPTLGRVGLGDLRIEGLEMRPRHPAAGDEIVMTLLLGNPGGEPLEHVVVPYRAPDPDAFERPTRFRAGFRGSIPPTAAGAPLRLSWTVRALREGKFRMSAPRAWYRRRDGERVVVRGEPLDVSVSGMGRVPLVGRDKERATLLGLLDRSTGEPAAAFVLGPPGSGKTRLGQEVRAGAAARGWWVARGRSLARVADVRGSLRDALRGLLGPEGSARDETSVTAALVSVLGAAVRGETELLAFLAAELVGRDLPRSESPARMWARLATRLARSRPFLLVLEDVGRDDEVARIALAMLRAARDEHVPLLLVVTARETVETDSATSALREGFAVVAEQGATVEVLRLGPLAPEDVTRLVDAALAPNDFPTSAPWIYDEIGRISGGNPLYVHELVRGLRSARLDDRALLATRRGLWTAASYFRRETLREVVPPGAEELVLRRLANLPPEARRLVRVAAVLGDAAESNLVRGAYGDDATFDEALVALEAEGILRETGGALVRVRFREPLLPDLLERAVRDDDPDLHRHVHTHAADVLSQVRDAGDRDALRRARHLAGAGRYADAFESYLLAAARLGRRQAFGRAQRAVQEAESLVADGRVRPRRGQRMRLLLLRAEALRFSGDPRGAARTYRELIDSAPQRQSHADVLATAHAKLGRVLEALGQDDEAVYAYAVGLSLREEQGLHEDVAMSLVNLAALHQRRGEAALATSYLDRAEQAARRTDNQRALGRALTLHARMLAAEGRTSLARGRARAALHVARSAHDQVGIAETFSVLADANLRDGRTPRALRWARRSLARRQEIGDLSAVGRSWHQLGTAHEALDHHEAARGAFERAETIQRRIGDRRRLARVLASRGRLELAMGMPRRATDTLDRAARFADEEGDPAGATLALAHGARAAILRGAGPEAEQAAEDLLSRATAAAAGIGDGETSTALALARLELRRAVSDVDAVLRVAQDALADPRVRPRARVEMLATRAELTSDRGAAEEALALAERGGRPRSLARALAACGRVAVDQGRIEDARPLLRRAVGLLRASDSAGSLLLELLRDLAAADEGLDQDSAIAARRLADDLEGELVRRGFHPSRLRRPRDRASALPPDSGSIAPRAAQPAPSGMERSHTFHLPSDLTGVPAVRERFAELCVGEGVDGEELDLWKLVFTELVNNAIEHGCDENAQTVLIHYSIEDRAVELRVQDPGSYDPALRMLFDRTTSNFAETGRGVGLMLVREFMDEIDVKPIEGGTQIRVRRVRHAFRADEGGTA